MAFLLDRFLRLGGVTVLSGVRTGLVQVITVKKRAGMYHRKGDFRVSGGQGGQRCVGGVSSLLYGNGSPLRAWSNPVGLSHSGLVVGARAGMLFRSYLPRSLCLL